MGEEKRLAKRKHLRRPAIVKLSPTQVLRLETVDVSSGGICVMFPDPVANGRSLHIEFEIPLGGSLRKVTCTAKVVGTVLVGMQGFRAGMQVLDINEAGAAAIAEYVGETMVKP